jgi:hypothetical protein
MIEGCGESDQGRQGHPALRENQLSPVRANPARLNMGVLAHNLPHMIPQLYVWGEEVKRSIL